MRVKEEEEGAGKITFFPPASDVAKECIAFSVSLRASFLPHLSKTLPNFF